MKTAFQKMLLPLLTAFVVGGMILLRVRSSAASFDFQSSNFSFFWVAGRMLLEGENPYDETQFLGTIEKYGIKWHPNKIFFYPLPLAIFCLPLGLFSLTNAYLLWQALSLVNVAVTLWVLLDHWRDPAHRRLFLPLFAALFLFGPLYLTLHTGSIGGFTLLVILGVILLFEKDKPLPAGALLSLTLLKTSQGLTILLLAGIWFLARRDWKAVLGVALGALSLLIIGLVQDPQWVVKFREVSGALMDRTQGVHSNIWAFAYLACRGAAPCATLLGAAGAMILLGLGGGLLWRNHSRLTAWEAFNIILPVGFLTTVYLWSYDQISYILPIIWIVGSLVERTRSYMHAFIFMIVLDIFSIYALLQHASTQIDLWSLGTTLIVLGMTLVLLDSNRKNPIDKVIPSA